MPTTEPVARLAVTVRVPLSVMGQQVKAVVVTGAEVTVLSHRVFEDIPVEKRPVLRETDRCLVVADAGKKMKTQGIVDIDVQIGDQCFVWPMYVAPIGDDLLLGCDMDDKDIVVSTKRGLELEGKWINCEVTRKESNIARVTLKRSVTIPATSEFVVTGNVDKAESIDTRFATLEPIAEDGRRVMIARSLVDPFGKGIPVRFINTSKSPVKLKKGYLLGELHAVDDLVQAIEELEEAEDRVEVMFVAFKPWVMNI